MDLLNLNKRTGEKLTAEELNKIGQAVDNNTRRLTELIASATVEISRLNQLVVSLQQQIDDIVDSGGGGGDKPELPKVLYGGGANTVFHQVLRGGRANTVFAEENILYGGKAKLS